MNYSSFIPVGLASLAILPSCQNKKQTSRETSPNILFIVSEDNSPFLGCYGDENAYTPNLDKLASEGVLYENAFACAPVSAPSRSTIITGMYASSLGTHHMRSNNTIPEEFHFFPYYLNKAGYYTVNKFKKDYNIPDQDSVWNVEDWWDYKDLFKQHEEGQPFFAMFNTFMSHESKIHGNREDGMLEYYRNAAIKSQTGDSVMPERVDKFNYMHQAGSVPLAPYHPKTPEMEEDWARYYDCMSMMDDEIGELLKNLKKDSLLENTIIFYFSDHGGVLGRSKRFTFESGLHVPFIVRFPEKYQHLAPAKPDSRLDRVISFVDLAPTVLNLAGLEIPENFQGMPFLGPNSEKERDYAFSFRGRMDERYDFSRTARNKKYRYIRNYMPQRPWGQHVNYLWKAKSMPSWEEACQQGECNETQSRFWGPKPAEELYDIENDPHNVNNLAHDPAYQEVLKEMREANKGWMESINDKNFIPEGLYLKNVKDTNGYEWFQGGNYDYKAVRDLADKAIQREPAFMPDFQKALHADDPVLRYWGAMGCCILREQALLAKNDLAETLADESLDVRVAASEALYFLGEKQKAKDCLKQILQTKGMGVNDYLELARTNALNVVDIMVPVDKGYFMKEIKELVQREEKGYDQRVAEYLFATLQL